MTQIFATIPGTNDLFIDKNGNLAIYSALQAVIQACEHAVKAQLGEMVLATDQGMPNFQTIWGDAGTTAQFEAALRKTISQVVDVTEVKSVDITIADNVLRYQAQIVTIYGEGLVNGG